MPLFWLLGFIVFWLTIWLQLFLVLFFFFSVIVAEYHQRLPRFLKWLSWLLWYVYFLPLHKFGFSRWQNWVYFVRHHEFTSSYFTQWLCEPTPWLFFMLFYVFLCFFYEWSLKGRFDYFLVFMFIVIALILFTV